MKVGLLACWYKNVVMANYAYDLKKALEKHASVSVMVVSSPCFCQYGGGAGDELQDNCVVYIRFPPFIFGRPRRKVGWIAYTVVQFALQLTRGMRYLSHCRSCDVIHYQQSAYSLGILPLIPVLLIPTSNKKVVTVHTLDKVLGSRFFSKIVYNRASWIIVHSKDMEEQLISIGVDARKIKMLPLGVNIPPLLGKERNEITFLGAPNRDKGAFVLLKALKILKQRQQRTIVHFYGIYSREDRLQLEAHAKELGVEDCISLGGRLSEKEFDEKLQESVFTFALNTVPVSSSTIVNRAMANATPIIATNLGAVPEYLKGSGILIPPNDPEALANSISRLAGDASLREQLSRSGRSNAMDLSWDNVAGSNLAVYLEALGH